MTRLLIAEDHARMREMVVGALETDYSVVDVVADGQQLLEAEARLRPDVVVLDISMPTMNGIEAATRLKQRSSNAKIVFLTVHEEHAFLHAALAVGAAGYVIKSRLASDLCFAISEAVAGRRFISPCLMVPCEDRCPECTGVELLQA